MKKLRACLLYSGGGTGGHLSPLVALIRHIRNHYPTIVHHFIGSPSGPEAEIISDLGFVVFHPLPIVKLRRQCSFFAFLHNIVGILKLPLLLIYTAYLLFVIRPSVVITSGGYVSFPVALISFLMRKPLIVHEQTLVPGLVNSLVARLASTLAISYEASREFFPNISSCVVTGNPIREELIRLNTDDEDEEKLGHLVRSFLSSLRSDSLRPFLYVSGSYQGAHALNRFIGRNLVSLLNHTHILHQAGMNNNTNDFEWLRLQKKNLPRDLASRYEVVQLVNEVELSHIYHQADVIFSRSGAGSIAEYATLGKVAVVVPYPYAARDEQMRLAQLFEQAEAIVLLPQYILEQSEEKACLSLIEILRDSEKRERLSKTISMFSHKNAVQRMADIVLHYLQ